MILTFKYISAFIFIAVFCAAASLKAQIPLLPDSTLADTLTVIPADSAATDSNQAVEQEDDEIDAPIRYWAEYINLSDDGNVITLYRDARLVYQNMELTAGQIKIDRRLNTLFAQGIPDSIDADSNLVYTNTPVFAEKGDEPMRGEFIEYNFNNRRGKIRGGKTEMEPGYYKGENIHKIGDSTLLVNTGYFTSCEFIDDPHYYFKSTRMRVKMKDKIVAEPILFYIADVPLFWLPFGIFPNKGGRHSGLLVPTFGESRAGGRYLRGMGYYWAPNDYFDADMMVDFYDKLGFAYRANTRYNIRYHLNGSLSGEYYPYNLSTGARQERWSVRFQHSQQIDPTFSISGSGNFVSDGNFSADLSPNMDQRLNQNLSSNFSINKRWAGTKNSLSMNLSHNYNLQTEKIDYTLPSLTFNHSQSNIFETISGENLGAKRSWYQNVYFSYNVRALHRGSRVPLSDSTFSETTKNGVQHNLNFSAPQKIFKYFNITPSFRYQEDWADEVQDAYYDPESKEIIVEDKKQFAARRTFTTSLGLKTTLYGMFEPNIGNLKFIRHKMDPQISMSFRPDFSDLSYGYFFEVPDSTGDPVKIDRFRNSAFGGTSSSESRSMSIRLGNVFQGKLIDNEGKEEKIELLTANFNTNYNFLRDSVKFSRLSSYLSTTIYGKRFDVRMQHSFYKPRSSGSGDAAEFASVPRLISLSTSFNLTLNNKTFSDEEDEEESEEELDDEDEGIIEQTHIQQERVDHLEETKQFSIPWSASFGLNYSLNQENVNNPSERIGLSARANFQLTKNWKIGWNAHLDMVTQEITSQSFNIYRDLHCWEMAISWQPQIDYYNFRINIKSDILKDLKVTKQNSASNRYYY